MGDMAYLEIGDAGWRGFYALTGVFDCIEER
jgi:hypothetical protein